MKDQDIINIKPKSIFKEIPFSEMVFVERGNLQVKDSGLVNLPDFWIGQYPVTQGLWTEVLGKTNNPSRFKGNNRPIETISWNQIQDKFLPTLNERTGKKYFLPSFHQWEYAARSGKHSEKYDYAGSNNINEVAWSWENSHGETKPVGLKAPNGLGLYDMSGNVWEWCEDKSEGNRNRRVLRGGSWNYCARYCRVSDRLINHPEFRFSNIGFRLCCFLV